MRKFVSAVAVAAAAAGLVVVGSGSAGAVTDSFGSGMWTVHEDIYTGVYEARTSDWLSCNISRYNEDWNQLSDNTYAPNTVVRMEVGWYDDHIWTGYGCGMWTRVGDMPAPPPPTPLELAAPVALGSAMVGSAMLPSVGLMAASVVASGSTG